MPDAVRHAFLKILYYTLISIRATKNTELIFALSHHAHNIPGLIDRYTPENFRNYWEVQRPSFLCAMECLEIEILDRPFAPFLEYWEVLEKHYENL